MKKSWRVYGMVHIGLLCAAVLFGFLGPALRAVAAATGVNLSVCLMHDFLRIYCPFCGGTRAFFSLLRLDFVEALRQNAAVTLGVPLLLCADGAVLLRLLRGKSVSPSWRRGGVLFALLWFLIFFAGRNAALILWKFDPLGDLLPLWL